MQAIASPAGWEVWRSPLVSVALHLLAIAMLTFVAAPPRHVAEREVPISVEIVAPMQSGAIANPARPQVMPPRQGPPASASDDSTRKQPSIPRSPPSLPSAGSGVPPLMRPQKMLSQGVLANPRSSAARRQLRTLAAEERAVQLCGIEAMEQVHSWQAAFLPEAVVAYATKSLKMRGGSIIADGAAFNSGGNWYRLRFECDVRGDEVVSFAYSVGDSIPRSEWEEYSLPEQVADDDR